MTSTNQEEVEEEVLSQLLDQDLDELEVAPAAARLVQPLCIRLTPLRMAPPTRDALPLNSSPPNRSVTHR